MNSTIKNAIIFIVIGGVLFSGYFFFIKPRPEEAILVTTATGTTDGDLGTNNIENLPNADSQIAKDLLVVLLNVKNITLNDAILSDPAFKNLVDSTVTLIPEKNEGRPNPFAPIGSDSVALPIIPVSPGASSASGLDVTPATNDSLVAPGASIPSTGVN